MFLCHSHASMQCYFYRGYLGNPGLFVTNMHMACSYAQKGNYPLNVPNTQFPPRVTVIVMAISMSVRKITGQCSNIPYMLSKTQSCHLKMLTNRGSHDQFI